MELAGSPLTSSDGTPIPLSHEADVLSQQEHVTIEYWGLAIPEGLLGWYGDNNMSDPGYQAPAHAAANNTYKAIRVIAEGYNIYYSVWCTNEREFYDLKVCDDLVVPLSQVRSLTQLRQTDPGEMRNLLSSEYSSWSYSLASRPFTQITTRLDALMMVLKSCKGRACVEPWRELHPQGDVSSLIDSLRPEFDAFYEAQPKVSFSACALGYLTEYEGPMEVNRFGADRATQGIRNNWQSTFHAQDPSQWSLWT